MAFRAGDRVVVKSRKGGYAGRGRPAATTGVVARVTRHGNVWVRMQGSTSYRATMFRSEELELALVEARQAQGGER